MTTQPPDAVYETGLRLWQQWTVMWNERPELALELCAERFSLHLAAPSLVDETQVVTPADVQRLVVGQRSKYQRLVFHVDGCGPFVDTRLGVVSGPWWAETQQEGTARVVRGMDSIAFQDGRVTEYWTLSREADRLGDWVTQRWSRGPGGSVSSA